MNQTDAAKIAMNGQRAGELVATLGVKALAIADDWRGQIRAATYDPTGGGGHRHDEYEESITSEATGRTYSTTHVVAVPHDPTGEADPNTPDQLRHARIVAAIAAYQQASLTVTKLILSTVPEKAVKAADESPEGACKSCWRDRHYYEPEALHKDGRVMHKGACRWCAGVKAEFDAYPPMVCLKRHHAGRRVSVQELVDGFREEGRTVTARAAS